jgi:LmbE family N-acetylglucosaminyl deacetylase
MISLVAVSPHLDDVVLSATKTLLAWAGPRVIATVFSGDPIGPLSRAASAFNVECELGHDAMARRRHEDKASCEILRCQPLHLGRLEALHRRTSGGEPVVNEERNLFEHDVLAEEADIVDAVADLLTEALAVHRDPAVLAPLGTGGHRDHAIVRAAIERICVPLGYYDDQPYGWWRRAPGPPPSPRYRRLEYVLTQREWERKQQALACHRSQMSMLWGASWADPVASALHWRAEARREALWAAA